MEGKGNLDDSIQEFLKTKWINTAPANDDFKESIKDASTPTPKVKSPPINPAEEAKEHADKIDSLHKILFDSGANNKDPWDIESILIGLDVYFDELDNLMGFSIEDVELLCINSTDCQTTQDVYNHVAHHITQICNIVMNKNYSIEDMDLEEYDSFIHRYDGALAYLKIKMPAIMDKDTQLQQLYEMMIKNYGIVSKYAS